MGWDIVPWGFEKLLSWIQKEYSPKGGILVSWNHLGSAIRWSQKWYGSGSMWHFLHVPQFMPIYACLQSNIEQPWSLNRFAPRGRPCGPAAWGDWKWVRSARDNGRRSREWPRLGERKNRQLLIWPTRGIITDCPYGKVWQSRKAIFGSIQTSTVIQMEDLQGPRVEHVETPRFSGAAMLHRFIARMVLGWNICKDTSLRCTKQSPMVLRWRATLPLEFR